MQLLINKEIFFEVEKISILKSHVDKISTKPFNGKNVTGKIDINISYIDTANDECFKALSIDYDIDIENIIVNDVKLNNTKLFVVDSQGVSIEYELELDYESINNEVIEEIVEIDDDSSEMTQDEIDKIKENINEDYENKLLDSLNSREEPNVSIIKTIDNRSTDDFLSFFNSKESSYYSLKTLFCQTDEELAIISKKYNVSIDDLLKGYDKVSKRVTFICNE